MNGYDALLVDLDGTVYRGREAIDGAVGSLEDARRRGVRLAYVTNNAARGPGAVAAHLAELGLTDDQDVLAVVLEAWREDRSRVASLSQVVGRAADAGDEAAGDLLDRAADELVLLARGTRRQIGAPDDTQVPLSWSGGMFSSRRVRERFAATAADFDVREPLLPPDLGAAVYAARLAGTPLDAVALDRLRASTGVGAAG